MSKRKPKSEHKPDGRPTKMTPETVNKLEEAYLMDCTDLEACLHADISKQTLYNYQTANPEFVDRKRRLKQQPFLTARKTITDNLKDDPKFALDYMKNKKGKEFGPHATLDLGNKDDKPFKTRNLDNLSKEELAQLEELTRKTMETPDGE